MKATLPLLFAMALPALAWADDPMMSDKMHDRSDNQATIYLGDIAVGGQREIYEAMQDIKLALQQPLSNDPKLADVVVCRIADDIGSHAKQLLICATNRVLNQNKEILEAAMSSTLGDADAATGSGDSSKGSPTGCMSANCYAENLGILNISLQNMRHHYMKQQVNGAALHALLSKIPYPSQPQPAPAAGTAPAPAAVTNHV